MTIHRMRWFVKLGDEMIPHTASMRGHWPGWDVKCSCGWESRTGGATKTAIREAIWLHKFETVPR